MDNKPKFKIFRVFHSKKAQIAVSKSIKIITFIVLGALLLMGVTMTIKEIVLPSTTAKVENMFEFDGSGDLGGSDGLAPSVDIFEDGLCTYSYYDSIENAVIDANNHTVENANADASSGIAQIAVRESDDMYIISPLSDVTISNPIEISNTLTFDTNGKNIELLKGAYFNVTGSAEVTLRDSGKGKIFKDVDSTNVEYLIYSESADSKLKILNGAYNTKNSGSVMMICSMGAIDISSSNLFTESQSNTNCISVYTMSPINLKNTVINTNGIGDTRCVNAANYTYVENCSFSSTSTSDVPPLQVVAFKSTSARVEP